MAKLSVMDVLAFKKTTQAGRCIRVSLIPYVGTSPLAFQTFCSDIHAKLLIAIHCRYCRIQKLKSLLFPIRCLILSLLLPISFDLVWFIQFRLPSHMQALCVVLEVCYHIYP